MNIYIATLYLDKDYDSTPGIEIITIEQHIKFVFKNEF